MNRDQFEAQWPQIKNLVQDKWSRLTDEDIRQINGRVDQFFSKVQQRYGYTREEIEDQIQNWRPNVRAEREDAYARSSRSEGASIGKWLLLAGIPLLFLLGYLGTHDMHDTTSKDASRQPFYTTTPASSQTDKAAQERTVQDARRALVSNGLSIRDLDDVTITVNNGVVTVSGSVDTQQQKDVILRVLGNLDGVNRVNDNLQIQ